MRDYQREAARADEQKVAALSDIVDVLVELPNQLVELINAIDRQTEVLERLEHKLEETLPPSTLPGIGDLTPSPIDLSLPTEDRR
jgi:hypothetical protein